MHIAGVFFEVKFGFKIEFVRLVYCSFVTREGCGVGSLGSRLSRDW